MIDVKQATQSASGFIAELFPAATISDVRLEEVELSEDERYWFITLSFPVPNVLGVLFPGGTRQYKVFKVDADTGEVLSMKIRATSNAAP